MFKIKNAHPTFTGLFTTARKYVGAVTTAGGLILDPTKTDGTINPYQVVVEVGENVTKIKKGDIVRINFKRYAKAKHIPGVIEDNVQSDNMTVVYEIPMATINDQDVLLVQLNDIEYFMHPDEVELDEGGLLQ